MGTRRKGISEKNQKVDIIVFNLGAKLLLAAIDPEKIRRELGWQPAIITGASVGTLNGCMFTLDKAREAEELWRSLEIHDVLEIPETPSAEERNRFLLDVIRRGGLDVEPLAERLDWLGGLLPRLEELERMYDAGIKGVKLHPDEQMIDLADKKMYPVYDLISDLGLPVVIHTGFDPFSPDHAHASPDQILKVRADFPKLRLILAHLGGYLDWGAAEELLAGKGMPMDPSRQVRRGVRQLAVTHSVVP